jgi:hypothetical protein
MSNLTISFPKDVHNLVTIKRYFSQQNLDFNTWALYLDVFATTLEEVAPVQAGVDYDGLTKAIESVKSTVRPNGRHRVDSKKVYANNAAQLEKAAEPKKSWKWL